jgi:hypothetical protein
MFNFHLPGRRSLTNTACDIRHFVDGVIDPFCYGRA